MPAVKKEKIQDFEKSLEKLEQVAAQMESGKLSLEEALHAFEEGVALARKCQAALEDAELRIKKLSTDGQGADKTSTLANDQERQDA